MNEVRTQDETDTPDVLEVEEAGVANGRQVGREVARSTFSPLQMISQGIDKGLDAETLGKLMALSEQWERNEARKAYSKAMVAFKSEAIVILKNAHVEFDTSKGVTAYDHASLDNVCDQIIPALNRHGLFHTWKPETTDKGIAVACRIMHELGHEESVTLGPVGADTSGGKNSIQGVASAVSYLERYTLLAACGLATKGQDDDARGIEGNDGMPQTQRVDFETAIEGAASENAVSELWKKIVTACEECEDMTSYKALKEKCALRKRALKKT